jgi:hypothetical protein
MSHIQADTASLSRYVATETCIAIVINAALGGIITSLVAHPATLGNATYWQSFGQLVMPTLGPASMLVPGITGVTRGRVAKGGTPAVRIAAFRLMPQSVIARAVIIGLAALALLGTTGGFLLWLYLHAAPPTLSRMVAFMTVYGAIFGLVVSPVVVIAALGDTPRIESLRRMGRFSRRITSAPASAANQGKSGTNQ